MWVYGVDSSYDLLTADEAAKLRANGVSIFVQALTAYPGRLEQPASRVISLRNALNSGLKIAGYALIAGPLNSVEAMQMARAGVPDDIWAALKFVAVDVETPGISIGQVNAALDHLIGLGKTPVVYTNWNSWTNIGNPQRRPGTWLWNAYWDTNPDIDFARLPFGGWNPEDVMGEQWSGGTYVQGQYVDRNQFLDSFITTGTPEPTPPPPPPPVDPTIPYKVALEAIRKIAEESLK